jgi:hypothetical protein
LEAEPTAMALPSEDGDHDAKVLPLHRTRKDI